MSGKISIVIRTLNEEKHLSELLAKINEQDTGNHETEVILVDSGSTDRTISIARDYDCVIQTIDKKDFTFGRSLNVGCSAASGNFLVFVSGHCIPATKNWLKQLVSPLAAGRAAYSYGRQIGNETTKFSEQQLFSKYFPEEDQIPQVGYFCNNANAGLLASVWKENRFDEDITGLEDMELAKRLKKAGFDIAYVADAPVFHIHDESWAQIRNRYEREAYALQHIMPEIHISFLTFLRYWFSAVVLDFNQARKDRVVSKTGIEIVMFRLMQYWGSYRGNHEHRQLSRKLREKYFYPANGQ